MVSGCQTHAVCCLVMPAEYRQLVLDRRQLGKFNLENTGQSLMHHQLSRYMVKWAHWQCMTSISLKTVWQHAEYITVQHVATSGNTVQYVAVHQPYNDDDTASVLLFVCFDVYDDEYIYIHAYWQWELFQLANSATRASLVCECVSMGEWVWARSCLLPGVYCIQCCCLLFLNIVLSSEYSTVISGPLHCVYCCWRGLNLVHVLFFTFYEFR